MADAHIALRALSRDYGTGRPAVDALDLDIEQGEFVGLLGPSGCGKTTTLRMIAGLVQPTAGAIFLGGREITREPAWRRNLGLVFQSYALFPHMTVAQNVAFGLRLRKVPRAEVERRVAEALRLVRLEGYGDRRPRELSGGQQQRVAIARALVIEPDVLLLDEPLSNLDARLRDEMRVEIREIQQKVGITTIFVTHDQQEALTLCDRIAVMRDGRLEQAGTPAEVYNRPATAFVAGFVGRISTIGCEVEERAGTRRLVAAGRPIPTPAVLPAGRAMSAMVRPHVVELRPGLADGEPGLVGTVKRRTFVGNLIEVEVDCGPEARVLVEVRPGSDQDRLAVPGAAVGLVWPAERTIVFPI
ncbi:MAG TPA: ABC transporter ATP-binding protein [Thermodesulfobacteriota bacterium]